LLNKPVLLFKDDVGDNKINKFVQLTFLCQRPWISQAHNHGCPPLLLWISAITWKKRKQNVQVRLSSIEFLEKMSWQKELEGTLGR
jgi:hypothetical protein